MNSVRKWLISGADDIKCVDPCTEVDKLNFRIMFRPVFFTVLTTRTLTGPNSAVKMSHNVTNVCVCVCPLRVQGKNDYLFLIPDVGDNRDSVSDGDIGGRDAVNCFC